MVSFGLDDGGQAEGYLVRPAGATAGVVVIQEWWGLVDHIKDIVGRFGDAGYAALAPDLYHGTKTLDAAEAEHLMQGLDWARAARELAAAVRYIRTQEKLSRVGVVGFCMGGALTIIAAAGSDVDGYVAFYGFPPAETVDLSRVRAPGLIIFGEEEDMFPVPAAQAFARTQQERGIDSEVVLYPNAGHAFFNDTRPEVYRPEAAADAWKRTLAFFDRTLREQA